MSRDAGDRYYGHGDHTTRQNSTGAQLDKGKWVVPTGDETVDYSDASGAGADLVGVLADDLPDGEKGNVHLRGVVDARVESGVTAGDELVAPDSANAGSSAGVASSGDGNGLYALTGASDPDGDGEYTALCLLR